MNQSVVLYALFAAYFAGVMVRLILTLTPVVCVLSAIAFSSMFELYLKDDENPRGDQSGKNDNLYDEVMIYYSQQCSKELVREMTER
jgi:dolichyl-diphosphooligosaccharide--protein glycosyltransferase